MQSKHKVFVVGLDGATWDLVAPWAREGLLPTFQQLMQEGTWGRLRSTIPPITAPAWTSFSTGKNPGKHGMYDFISRRSDGYRSRPLNASLRDGESLWGLLSRAGKQVGVINVPMTYPPEQIKGFMVAGMGTPASAEDFCYPVELLHDLRQAVPGYVVQHEGIFDPRGRESQMLQAVREMTAMRQQTVLHFLDHAEWDFFIAVFMATDLLQHYFWHLMDSTHPRHDPTAPQALKNAILDCYRQLDDYIRQILDRVGDDTYLVVMSDHGFGPQEQYLHVNTWLWHEGYLRFKRNPLTRLKEMLFAAGFTPLNVYELIRKLRQSGTVAKNLRQRKEGVRETINRVFLSFRDVDWQQTRAYSVGNIGPIYVNLKGREPEGIVQSGQEYEDLLAELTDALLGLRDPNSGEQIVEQIYRREEIYQGPHVSEAPDLLFIPRDMKYIGYGLLQFSSNHWLAASDRCGGHRMDGLLMMRGPGIRPAHELATAQIIDLAPTILTMMGIPIPTDMDGQVLTDALSQEAQAEMKVRYQETLRTEISKVDSLSAQEDDEILGRLRGLGYVG